MYKNPLNPGNPSCVEFNGTDFNIQLMSKTTIRIEGPMKFGSKGPEKHR